MAKFTMRERIERSWIRTHNYLEAYLSNHPCVKCGETDPILLDFDHIDPHTKTRNISEYRHGTWSIKSLEKEIAKCQILCANCHRRKTRTETRHLVTRVHKLERSP